MIGLTEFVSHGAPILTKLQAFRFGKVRRLSHGNVRDRGEAKEKGRARKEIDIAGGERQFREAAARRGLNLPPCLEGDGKLRDAL